MLPPEAVSALAALFIVAMVWLRTRMQYAKGVSGGRSLTAAGAVYFAVLGLLLVLGWFAAPALAHRVSSPVPVAPTLARVVWFLAVYYLFIPLHRALRARGLAVFRSGGK
jgi:fumarate reductase subunit D